MTDEDELAELAELRAEEAAASRWPDRFGPPLVLVCRCHCVEDRELEALAAAGCSVEDIARETGATTGCSSCRPQVEAIVAAARARRGTGGTT